MAVVAGCQEVQGACLETWKGLRRVWNFWGFEGFERRANGTALNALKNRWPWWLAAKRCKGPAWRVALERLAEGLEHFEGFEGLKGFLERAGKRQPWMPLKTDGRGGWLPRWCKGPAWRVALERLAERFGAFWGFEEAGKRDGWLAAKRCKGPACLALERLCGGFGAFWGFEGFEGFEGGQTAALNALKNRWPWWLAAKRCKGPAWRVALESGGFGAFLGFEGLRAGKQPWMPLKQMAGVAGCQEVQGACLEGCLGKACGGFGAFWGFEGFGVWQTASLECP